MRPNREHLAALLAVVDTGTFEAAAAALHVTPSAISQRIKALESQLGHVVVIRSNPCRVTDPGARLLRMARQIELLERETFSGMGSQSPVVDLPVAVNADSLATWFPTVLSRVAAHRGIQLRLYVEDQEHTTALMRDATVLAAVASDRAPVQGCSVEPLGAMRYVPVATPGLLERHTSGRRIDWQALPVVRFNDKDDLQHDILAARGVSRPDVCHVVPSSEGFAKAVHAGLGWGALPESDLGDSLARGSLRRLGARLHVDVPLYWQRWRIDSPALDLLSDAVRHAARAALRS